jgi:hypothetical protein
LLEVFYSIKNSVPFQVYLTEEQQRHFLEYVTVNFLEAMLIFSRISTRQSTCWVLNDQLRIHSLIESSVGFEAVDKVVHEAIADALKVAYPKPDVSTQPIIPLELTNESLKESLVTWFRNNGNLEESKAPSSIDIIFHYDSKEVNSD